MNLLCPSCQKMLQVPEQYAGQMMKCPLCTGTFTVPALPQSPSAPAPHAPPPPMQAPAAAGPSAAPPQPQAGYQHVYSILVTPNIVQWITPAALLVLFFLMFFPWLEKRPAEFSGWDTAFGEQGGFAGALHAIFFILSFLAALVSAAITFVPKSNIPPAVQQLLPWRSAAVGGLVALAFLFLVMEVSVAGFGPENTEPVEVVVRTTWQRLAVFMQLLAVVGVGLEFWLTLRGPSRPLPRIDVNW